MKLRDHPLMIRNSSFSSWPPAWQAVGLNNIRIQGELGILEDVSAHDLIPNKIFLAMEHLGERYITVLAFDDAMFTKQLCSLLEIHIGRSRREIGDLDLSHLL